MLTRSLPQTASFPDSSCNVKDRWRTGCVEFGKVQLLTTRTAFWHNGMWKNGYERQGEHPWFSSPFGRPEETRGSWTCVPLSLAKHFPLSTCGTQHCSITRSLVSFRDGDHPEPPLGGQKPSTNSSFRSHTRLAGRQKAPPPVFSGHRCMETAEMCPMVRGVNPLLWARERTNTQTLVHQWRALATISGRCANVLIADTS